MFYNLQTIWQLILTVIGILIFAGISWKWPRAGAWLVIFLAPLYLLKIGNLPLTVLEALIWVFVTVWAAKKVCTCRPELVSEPPHKPKLLRCRNKFGMTKEGVRNKIFLPLLLILFGVITSTIFSADWRVSAGILKSWFLAPIFFAFILGDIFEDSGFKEIGSALFVSATVVAAISLVYLIFGRLTFDGRLAAFYLSPNHLAMWLAPGILAGFGLWFEFGIINSKHHPTSILPSTEGRRKILVLLFAICYSLLAIALYFTYSYGAWLGLATALIFILIYFWRLKIISQQCLFYVLCFMFFVFALVFVLQLYGSHGEKLISLLSSPRSSWQSRLMVWQAAVEILKDHWLIGIGPGLFQKYYLDYRQYFSTPYLEWAVPQPHNLFLAFWLQAGLAGFIGFIWLLVNFFRRIFNFLAETKIKLSPAIFLAAVMVYFLVHGLADTTFWKNDLALLFWAIAFLGHRAGRRVC